MKKPAIAAVLVVIGIIAVIVLRRGGDEADKAAEPEVAAKPDKPVREARRMQAPDLPEARFLMDDDVAGNLRLEGQVVDSNKDPIEGALVWINSNPPREARSAEDGSFFFDKLGGRQYRLVAQADEGVAGPVTARLTDTNDPVILIVKPAASVEVTVRSAVDRKPISGATVELRGLLSQTADTGSDGVALIELVPSGGYQVVARANGYAQTSTWTRIRGGDAKETIDLDLKGGASVAGRVIDPSGAPLPGAVVLYSGASDWSQQANERYDGVVTDAKGEFRIAALPAGTFRFRARHSDYAAGLSEPITLDGTSERTGVLVQMQPGAILAGVVVDTSGKPVPGAAVRVAQGGPGMRWGRPRQTFSDDEGKFEMKALPRAEMNVVAVHETATSETETVDLEATPEKTDLTLALDVDGRIAGTVVDSEQEPVEGAQVMLWPNFRRGGGGFNRREFRLRGRQTALTGAGGNFEFRGLKDMPYRVRANPPGVSGRGSLGRREGVDADVGDLQVVIVLEKDGVITGKVAYDDGEAPEAFTVSLGGWRGGRPFANKDGKFELTDVPARTYQVTIRGVGFEQTQVPDVEVAPGQEVDLGTITVTKGRTIAGRVVTAAQVPVPGATVTAGRMLFGSGSSTSANSRFGPPGTRSNKTVTTDDSGEFFIHGVASSDINLIAEHETQGRTLPVTVPGSKESTYDVILTMEATGALEGIVTMGGQPADSVRISCQSQDVPGAIFGVATGADGKFRFDKLAPGNYMVSAMTGGNPMRGMGFHDGKQVAIVSKQTSRVALDIGQGNIQLSVTLKPTEGELNFAQIFSVQSEVTATTAKEMSQQMANRDGGYSSFGMSMAGRPAVIRDLSPGNYTVCAAPYPNEVQGMRPTLDYMEREGDNMKIFCRGVTVTEQPEQQEVVIPVEVPAFVPPETEG